MIRNLAQSPSSVFMVRPNNFGYNYQTAGSNAFQNDAFVRKVEAAALAQAEFDNFADRLKSSGIVVLIFEEDNPEAPDAIFPNNWVSFHDDGAVVLYPMMAANRRLERREDIIYGIEKNYRVSKVLDLSKYEMEEKYLEGTGSIVFDYANKIAYACRSPRTNKELLHICCRELGYRPVVFNATDRSGVPVYHTNVLMTLTDDLSVICLESIEKNDRSRVKDMLYNTNHEVIEIKPDQMEQFAGNMMQLTGNFGRKYMAMSEKAFRSLHKDQLKVIENFAEPLYSDLNTIETLGGGSARCMMAEIFLPLKKQV